MKETVVNQFGRRVRQLRKKHNVTQQELANKAKISLKYLQSLEGQNPQNPSLVIMQKIADGFGIPLWKILKMDE